MIEELNVYVHTYLAVNIKVFKRKSRAGFVVLIFGQTHTAVASLSWCSFIFCKV